jgi:hypothetical protein
MSGKVVHGFHVSAGYSEEANEPRWSYFVIVKGHGFRLVGELCPKATVEADVSRLTALIEKCAHAEWLRGYAAALGNVDRQHDQPGHVRDALVGDGLTVEDFEAAGVEEYDLAQIRKAMKG